MATFTSKAAGNWSAAGQTTWNEANVPGDGDTVTLTHAVTVDVDTTVGHSPGAGDATAAILINDVGQVLIPEGVTLTVRGDIISGVHTGAGRYVIDSAGGSLFMNPTQAVDPTAAAYVISPNANNNKAWVRFAAGAGGTRPVLKTVVIDATTARARGTVGAYTTNVGLIDMRDTDVVDFGDATNSMWQVYLGDAGFQRLYRNTFTRCGLFDLPTTHAAGNIIIRNNKWTDSLNANSITINSGATSTGTRDFIGNILDKPVKSGLWNKFIVTYNVFKGDYAESAQTVGAATWRYNVIFKGELTYTMYAPLIEDTLLFSDWDTGNQSQNLTLAAAYAQELRGCIGQLTLYDSGYVPGEVSDIEVLIDGGSTAAVAKTVTKLLILPASDRTTGEATVDGSGSVFVGRANAGATMEYYHCTVHGGRDNVTDPIFLNHPGFNLAADRITAFKSCLYYDSSARRNFVGYYNTPVADDILSPAGITNNAAWNWVASEETGSEGTPYSYPTTAAPGTNDVPGQVDPKFFDPTRNFEGFAVLYGQSRSRANALTVVEADPETRIPLLIAWIKAGFSPTNPLLKGTAHDSGDIGAVDVTLLPVGQARLALEIGLGI